MLSPRELEILVLREQGLAAKEIAEHLHISKKTVESHLRTIFIKTRTMSSLAAVYKIRLLNGLPTLTALK